MTRPVQITREQAIEALQDAVAPGGTVEHMSENSNGSLTILTASRADAEYFLSRSARFSFHDHLFGFDLAVLSHRTSGIAAVSYLDVPRPQGEEY